LIVKLISFGLKNGTQQKVMIMIIGKNLNLFRKMILSIILLFPC